MTPSESAVLERMMPAAGAAPAWLRPMDFGGAANTAHAIVARRMVAKGWVERREREALTGIRRRPAYEFRITPAGAQALFNARSLRRG